MKPPVDAEVEVLSELASFADRGDSTGGKVGWARPQDCGGTDGSYHSRVLAKMVTLGYAERWDRSLMGGRHSYLYRITPAGRALIEAK